VVVTMAAVAIPPLTTPVLIAVVPFAEAGRPLDDLVEFSAIELPPGTAGKNLFRCLADR
jgi:hypothetical protein